MNLKKEFVDICNPAKVYVVFALIGILSSIPYNMQHGLSATVIGILVGLLSAYLFTWFVNFICRKVSVNWAWFLVFGLPILMFFIIFIFLILIFKNLPKKHKN